MLNPWKKGGYIEGRNVPEKPKEKEKTNCVKCDEDLDKSYLLQRHLDRYHRGFFAYNFPQCNKGLSTPTGLKQHLLTHQNDADSHMCPNCGKGFKLKKTMNQHIKNSMIIMAQGTASTSVDRSVMCRKI